MVYAFEDNENTPSSKLLAVTENCKFSGGCLELPNLIRTLEPGSICFIDSVPDNKTIRLFAAKMKQMCDEKNITLITVPCIEYFLLLLINREQIEELPIEFTEAALYLSYGIGFAEKKYSDRSFEKFCKRILSERIHKCLHNKNKERLGFFYTEDCVPDHYLCKIDKIITLSSKSSELWLILKSYIDTVDDFQGRLFNYISGEK